jgi:hypothetical protein
MKDIIIEDYNVDLDSTDIVKGPTFECGKPGEVEVTFKDLRVNLELNVSYEGLQYIKEALKDYE